jgi:EpsG family
MYFYALFLLIPLMASFLFPGKKRRTTTALWWFFIPLLIYVGLRHEVGPDWPGYENYFGAYSRADWDDVFTISEPSFFLLIKLSDEWGLGLHGVMFVCAFFFLYGLISYATRTEEPWLALAVVMPYLVFVIGMSGIRQAAAIGIGYYMLAHRKEWHVGILIALIGFAASFHSSAVVFFLFLLLEGHGNKYVRAAAVMAVAYYLVTKLGDSDTFNRYKSGYVETNMLSGGAYAHVMLTAFPAALYLLFRKRIVRVLGEDKTVHAASWLAVLGLPMVAVSSTGTDRLVLYFSFVQMMVYPALIKSLPAYKREIKWAAVLLALTIFLVYFMFGEHAQYFLPYKNILFI